MLTVALSKGRMLVETLPLFAAAGVEPREDPFESRRLVLDTNRPDLRFLVIRAADVVTYVRFGAADAGVAGKDQLMERGGDGLYEPLDLAVSRCRLVVAEPGRAPRAAGGPWNRPRVATKYPNVARRHFHSRGVQAEIVRLYGSMELAPLVRLADRIVDLVDSGATLKANGLVEVEHVAHVSARFVVNRAAMKLKAQRLNALTGALRDAVARASNRPCDS